MVVLAGWLTYKYITLLPAIIASTHLNWITVLVVGGPPCVGGIVTFFLFKPLLSKPPKPPEAMELRREDAPMLFQFVDGVCGMIGAPPPKRIDIDLQVNASASLHRGFRSMASNDLTLTIGLPLAAGLTTRQFAGVLGHEFGHFTQWAGMRTYFLIWKVRYWFARVAYERDHWDLKLEQMIKTGDWRMRAVFRTAEGTVGLSRSVLRGLLHTANWISAWFSRQMEFDADRHAAALVGDETFEDIQIRLPLLSAACQSAWSDVNQSWSRQRLAEDFPALVQLHDQRITPESRNDVVESVMGEKTERLATHPSTRERIENVKGVHGALAEPLDQAAALLFPEFTDLCRRATQHHYEFTLADAVQGAHIVPSHVFLAEVAARTERVEAQQTFFANVAMPSRWFILPDGFRPEGEWAIHCAVAEDPSSAYWSALEQSLNRTAALEFLRAGGKIQQESFDLDTQDVPEVEEKVRVSYRTLQDEIEKLREKYRGNGYLLRGGPSDLAAAYRAISAEQTMLLELRHAWIAARLVVDNMKLLSLSAAPAARQAAETRLRTLCEHILNRLDRAACPVGLPGAEPSSLGLQVLPGIRPEVFNSMPAIELAQTVLSRADEAAELLLGELCLAAKRSWGVNTQEPTSEKNAPCEP
jgi:peptidase M48-like protein